MNQGTYALGLDSSTQSLTGIVIDIDDGSIVYEKSLDYAKDPRLNRFGIDFGSYTIPPRQPGEADQPPEMYLASIDAFFSDMVADGVDCKRIAVINNSGQQHGHVYLAANAKTAFDSLRAAGSGSADGADLVQRLDAVFAYGTAPIWKTSNTHREADFLRKSAGGSAGMIELSGSDSPLRFTGAVIRRVGEQFPEEYAATATVQLISSFIPSVLTGNARTPWDFGNGCGTSIMEYRGKRWAKDLIGATSEGLPGGVAGLEAKLPGIVSPDSIVETVAAYFVEKYSIAPDCSVCAGSGDNPQTKVLVAGDLLSLGTSFVNMVSTDGDSVDPGGYANAMYDGLGRPFMFGCRTNGAMVWDWVRELHGLDRGAYKKSDSCLASAPLGDSLFLWQPDTESFPPSPVFGPTRIGYEDGSLERDYPGAIESSLGIVYLYSRGFAAETEAPIYLTGGVTRVGEIVRRVAAIWKRPVVTIGTVGAALGAAVAGASAKFRESDGIDVEQLSASVLPRSEAVTASEADIAAFHGAGGGEGYLARLDTAYRMAAEIGK